jgi:hypothetical protein
VNPQTALQERYPAANLVVYNAFMELCRQFEPEPQKGLTQEHHICPRKQFPEHEHAPENLITLRTPLHQHAHRLLGRAVPEICNLAPWIAAGASPEVRERQQASIRTPEALAKKAATLEKRRSDPEARARLSAQMSAVRKITCNTPEARSRISTVLSRPEVKSRMSAAIKGALNRPEVKARHSAGARAWALRPDVRAMLSARAKAQRARQRAAQEVASGLC